MLFYKNNNLLQTVFMKNFIKQLREDRRLTTAQLAEKVGTSQQQISNLENGKRKLSWQWIQRLADALECHSLEITEGSSTIAPRNDQEKELLRRFRGFNDGEKQMFSHMLKSFKNEQIDDAKATDTDHKNKRKS